MRGVSAVVAVVLGLLFVVVGVVPVRGGYFTPTNVTSFILANKDYEQLPVIVSLSNRSSPEIFLSSGGYIEFDVQVDPSTLIATLYLDGVKVKSIDLNGGSSGDDILPPVSDDNDLNTLRYIATKSVTSEVYFDAVDFSAGYYLDSFWDEDGINGGDAVGIMVTVPGGTTIQLSIETQGFFDRSAINSLIIYNKDYTTLPVKVHINDAINPEAVNLYATGSLKFSLDVDQSSGTTHVLYGDYTRIVERIDLNDGSAGDDLNCPNSDSNDYNTLQYFAGHTVLGSKIQFDVINFFADTFLLAFDDDDGINGGAAAHFEQYQEDNAIWIVIETA